MGAWETGAVARAVEVARAAAALGMVVAVGEEVGAWGLAAAAVMVGAVMARAAVVMEAVAGTEAWVVTETARSH